MNSTKKISKIIDQWYLEIMAVVAPIVMYLNWYAQGMAGLLPNYQQYKVIIKNGFYTQLITFPMWGYGWLMVISENKLFLLTVQMILALGALAYFIKCLEREKIFTVSVIRTFKLCMIVSLPWYAFHALRWPYSIAASLFLIALVLLYKAVMHFEKSLLRLILSAICFGVVLNFRSDYILMPLGIAALVLLFFRSKRSCLQMSIWLFVLYSCLVPWAIYTKKACGHYLLTSTNGGHVMFVGLGNNPGNRWGITADDNDPLMHALVDEHMQQNNALTSSYKADHFLKKTFFTYIIAYPKEYLKKIVHVFCELVCGGCYPGEFFMDEYGETPLLENTRIRLLLIGLIKNPIFIITQPIDTVRIVFTAFSCAISTLLILFAYLCMPLTVWHVFFRKSSFFMLLVLAALAYQTLINCCCFHMTSYLGNVYVLYFIQALYACTLMYGYRGVCYQVLCRFYK